MPSNKAPIRKPVTKKNEREDFVSLLAASTDGRDLKAHVKIFRDFFGK